MKVPLKGSTGETGAVETELPGVVTSVDRGTNLGGTLKGDMIIKELTGGGTPLSLAGESPVEVSQSGLLFLVGNLNVGTSNNLTIRGSPSESELTLVARNIHKLAVKGNTEEQVVSQVSEFNLLIDVLLDSVKVLEPDILSFIRVTELERLMLRGTISVDSAVGTSE